MRRDISASKFQGIGSIVSQSKFDKYEKNVPLSDIIGTLEKLVTSFQETLTVINTVVKDIAFILIQSVASILLLMFQQCFTGAKMVLRSLMPEFN